MNAALQDLTEKCESDFSKPLVQFCLSLLYIPGALSLFGLITDLCKQCEFYFTLEFMQLLYILYILSAQTA